MKKLLGVLPAVMMFLAAGCPGPNKPVGAGSIGQPQALTVSLSQDGKPIGIVNHEAYIEKKTFTVVLAWPKEWVGVMVHASASPILFNAVMAGRPAGGILPGSFRPLRLGLGNPRQLIIISDKGYNFWYYYGERSNTFDEMIETDTHCICKRIIANYSSDISAAAQPVEALKADELYLTFVKAGRSGSKRIGTYAATVKLVFK